MPDTYTLHSSPAVITSRSVDSFIELIYMKENSKNSISYLASNTWNDLGTSKSLPLRTGLNTL